MKICLLNDSFPPVIDGVANTVKNYADILNKIGDEAIVAVPDVPNAEDNYEYGVIRYKSLPTDRFVGYRAGYPFSASTIGELENSNLEIIHSHCPFMSTVMGRILRERLNIPLVLTYHTKFDIDIARIVKSERIKNLVVKSIVDNISSCDEVWAVSRGAADNLKSLGYQGNIVIMKNGVDFPNGKVSQDRIDKLAVKYDIDTNKPIYLFVGRMRWYKGIRIILDGLAKLKKSNRDFTMIFVGKGEDVEEMKRYAIDLGIIENCLFAGPVYDREELREYYSLADLFLFPSSYDTFGLVVVEAAACGTPSILIKNSAAAEEIEHGFNGWTIDEDGDSMYSMLLSIGNNRQLLNHVGHNAQETLYMSWEDSIKNASNRYRVICENYENSDKKRDTKDEIYNAIGKICDAITSIRGKKSDLKEFIKNLRFRILK